MANRKGKSSRKRHSRRLQHFPEVKGKIVESVELDPDAQSVSILFSDKTALSFDVDSSHVIFPELADYKTGNWKGIKRWQPVYSPIAMVKWP